MENKSESRMRSWNLMQDNINSLQELSEQLGKAPFAGDSSQINPASLFPLALLEKKLKDLDKHIKQYAQRSIILYLDSGKIDRLIMANGGDSYDEMLAMSAELDRITLKVLMDIKMKQIFLKDFAETAHTYNFAPSPEYTEMEQKIQDVCFGFHQTLDLIIELILAFSKYRSRNLAALKFEIKKKREISPRSFYQLLC